MSLFFLLLLSLAPRVPAAPPEHFSPAHRIIGIGADRDDLSAEQIALRAGRMIEAARSRRLFLMEAKEITGTVEELRRSSPRQPTRE